MAENSIQLKGRVNVQDNGSVGDAHTFKQQIYGGQLELQLLQKRDDITLKILGARQIRGYDRLHVEVSVYGKTTTSHRLHRTQSIHNSGETQWNNTWKCTVTSGQHRYVTLSLWNRSNVDKPSDLVGCMTFELQQPSTDNTAVIADGSYYLLHESLGAHKNLKVQGLFDLRVPLHKIHLQQTNNITEQHRVVLQLHPPAAKIGLKLRGTDAAIISVIRSHSPAERAGLMIGDVITSVNKTDVTGKDGAVVKKQIRMHDYRRPLVLTVTRKHGHSLHNNVLLWR